MKKYSFVTVAALAAVLTAAAPAKAQEKPDLDSVTVEEQKKAEGNPFSADDFNKTDESQRGIFDIGSTDEVTIAGDGLYDIRTSLLSCEVYPPFGWLCVTQDFALQFDTFNTIYQDPLAAAKEMVGEGMHLFMIDYSFDYSVELYFSEDSIGKVIQNSLDLDEEDENTAVSILTRMYFPNREVLPVTLGNYRFYHFPDATGASHVYETYVNGICVDVMVNNIDGSACEETVLEDVESMLSEIKFS